MIPTPDNEVSISSGGVVLLVLGGAAALALFARQATPPATEFDSEFDRIGKKYAIPPNLLRAIAVIESSMNPTAVGVNRNAQGVEISRDHGLMQLNDRTLRVFKATKADAYSPAKAIDIAAQLLSAIRNELRNRGTFSALSWAGAYNVGSDLIPADKAHAYASKVYARWTTFELAKGA